MNGLDLFSGIGGLSLALSEWVKTVAYCESDRYAQGVLLSRMQDGTLDTAPIWDDVTTLKGKQLPRIDIIFGGFPCQDISVAGSGTGLGGERSGLFYEICRLVRELRPRFVFLENVPVISLRGLDRILLEFTSLRYDTRWTTVSAEEIGAKHFRERWFMLSHAKGFGVEGLRTSREQITHTHERAFQSMRNSERSFITEWSIEPDLDRVVNGFPSRVDRIKCLGNAVVPLQAKEAFKRLSGLI